MSLRNDIKAYLDGELDGDTALRVAQILQSDESLRKEADDYRALSSTLRLTAEPDVAPKGLEDTLRALRLKNEPTRPRAWWAGGWGYALAGVAVVVMIMIFFPVSGQSRNRGKFSATKADAAGAVTLERSVLTKAPMASAKSAQPSTVTADAATSAPSALGANPGAAGAEGGGGSLEAAPYPDANPALESTPAPAVLAAPTTPPVVMENPKANISDKRPVPSSGTARRSPSERRFVATRRQAPLRNVPVKVKATSLPPTSRLVIENGTLSLYVSDVQTCQTKVEGVAKNFGGYVENSNLFESGGDVSRQATVTIRVPANRFAEALASIRSFGEVYQQQISGQDVTAQVANTEGRLNSLKAEAERLRQLTSRTHNVDEVLHVRDRLSQVDQEISGMESQTYAMKDQAAMSTLTVTLGTKPKPAEIIPVVPEQKSWMDQTFGDAADTFSSLFKMLFNLFAQLLALSPIWVPIVGLSYWAWRVSENKRGY